MLIDHSPSIRFYRYVWQDVRDPKRYLKARIKELFTYRWDIPTGIRADILFFQSMKRSDYDQFMAQVESAVRTPGKRHIDVRRREGRNFELFTVSIAEILHIYRSAKVGSTSYERAYLFIMLWRLTALGGVLHGYDVKIVATHADMQPVENFIIGYFNKKGVRSVTFQHGLYIDYTQSPNINEVNYQSVVSKYFLAWGEETKQLIAQYHPICDVVICGKPTPLHSRSLSDRSLSGFLAVIGDQKIFRQYNQELLDIGEKIALEYGLKILLRLHPLDDLEAYRYDAELYVEDEMIEEARFVLGHTSSMICELMRSGVPVYKYQTRIPSNEIDPVFVFHDREELTRKMKEYDADWLQHKGSYHIQYTGEESLRQYGDFFERLLETSEG